MLERTPSQIYRTEEATSQADGWLNHWQKRELDKLDSEFERVVERDEKPQIPPSVFDLLRIFWADRPVMARENKNTDFIEYRIGVELQEAIDAPTNHLGRDKHKVQEYVDIINFCVAGILGLGFDPEAEIREKIAKSSLKHKPSHYVEGMPFATGIRISSEEAERTKLDQEFYAEK